MSGFHVTNHDCFNQISQALGEASVDEETFARAWEALGVVVAVIYRAPKASSPVVVRPAVQPTAPDPQYSVCPECGFESITQNATKLHVKRMHTEPQPDRAKKSSNGHAPSKKELWERSHAPGLPYPGEVPV